jgi:hypothetical protein
MPYGVLIVTGAMSHQEAYATGFQQDRRCKLIAVTDEKDVDERRARLNQKLADQLNIPISAILMQRLRGLTRT